MGRTAVVLISALGLALAGCGVQAAAPPSQEPEIAVPELAAVSADVPAAVRVRLPVLARDSAERRARRLTVRVKHIVRGRWDRLRIRAHLRRFDHEPPRACRRRHARSRRMGRSQLPGVFRRRGRARRPWDRTGHSSLADRGAIRLRAKRRHGCYRGRLSTGRRTDPFGWHRDRPRRRRRAVYRDRCCA